MPAFNFSPQFAAPIESGAKVLTMRAPRKDGRFPAPLDAPNPLRLYTGMRHPSCRVLLEVPHPVVVATVTFDATGYRWASMSAFHAFRAGCRSPVLFADWRDSRDAVQTHRNHANVNLAQADGFDTWADLWAWHEGVGVDDRGMATRDLVGWA